VDFDDLLKRISSDPEFRTQLVQDPRAALTAAGVDVTDDMVSALRAVDYKSIERVAELFNKGEIRAETALC